MGVSLAGASVPAYPHRHSGPVLVCGSAWCLHDDLARARAVWPDAPVIAVNGAAGEVAAFALFTQHPRKFPRWIAWQRARFGDSFSTHAAGRYHLKTNLGKREPQPWVDYWWEGVASSGTSGWGARRLAGLMGFNPVVLCGVPMKPGPYAGGGMISRQFRDESGVEAYRAAILKDTDWHDGVVSMSGWTREVLGGPDG